jgi:hypothetical protein
MIHEDQNRRPLNLGIIYADALVSIERASEATWCQAAPRDLAGPPSDAGVALTNQPTTKARSLPTPLKYIQMKYLQLFRKRVSWRLPNLGLCLEAEMGEETGELLCKSHKTY